MQTRSEAPEQLAAIVVKGVSRRFESGGAFVTAIDDVSMQVRRGESVALTGPSGSGKTTLLNLIAGLDRPTSGEVWVLGEELSRAREVELTAFRARALGLIFQDPQLLPGLTALENVIAARLPWARWRALEPDARRLLHAVGLDGRLDFPPARLSGGERQRVGIARALLGKPTILLADEPSGNLDLRSTEEILALLQQLRTEMGLTTVTVTHDPAVAAGSDRILRLAGGRLVDDLTPRPTRQPSLDLHRLEP